MRNACMSDELFTCLHGNETLGGWVGNGTAEQGWIEC